MLKGETSLAPLNEDEKERCSELVREFLSGSDVNVLPIFEQQRTKLCFEALRDLMHKEPPLPSLPASDSGHDHQLVEERESREGNNSLAEHLAALKLTLQARDNEIAILVSMLKANEAEMKGSKPPQSRQKEKLDNVQQKQEQQSEQQQQQEQEQKTLLTSHETQPSDTVRHCHFLII